MNDRLFRLMLELLMAEAETRRDEAQPNGSDRDMWSAVSDSLDNARKRMKK